MMERKLNNKNHQTQKERHCDFTVSLSFLFSLMDALGVRFETVLCQD